MRERREEVGKEEGADNRLMSAAALVLFAFRGDAAAAPPTDLLLSVCRTADTGTTSPLACQCA